MSRHFTARGRTVTVDGPALMGIVNASPESFSGDGATGIEMQAALAVEQFAAGALLVDVGGQSANTKTPELAVAEETERLVPLIEEIRRRSDGILSVDTYKPAVADACLRAGADVINDVSALHDPALADVVSEWEAGYVLMHTIGPPKVKLLEPDWYEDGVAHDVAVFFDDKLELLRAAGVAREAVMLDPGIDFSKTPRQSVELLHDLGAFARFDRPLLLALSRKDFVGAITPTSPRQRDPGTLAAIGFTAGLFPDTVYRVHEVDQSRQFLDVLGTLAVPATLDVGAALATDLRIEAPTDDGRS